MTTNLPEGYQPLKGEVPANTPPAVHVMEYEKWQRGGEATYRGIVDLAPDSDGKKRSKVHTISGAKSPDGELYGLWRCKDLDDQLKYVRAGEVVYLRYEGKRPHPTMSGSEMHTWTVGRKPGAPKAGAATADGSDELPAEFR